MDKETMRDLQTAADGVGLEMEFLELKQDAERYRWLRDQAGVLEVAPPYTANYYFTIAGEFNPMSGFMDDAFDAAMADASAEGAA